MQNHLILVTLSGIITEARDVQPLNAEPPILVTPSGITTDSRDLQPIKAPAPIFLTLSGITVSLHPTIRVFEDVSIIALQLFLLSYTVFLLSTFMLDNDVQP